jgi:drug/metabolite transporter (DMT)-like permease
MKSNTKQLYSYLALIIAPFLWSGNFAIGRALHLQIPPFTLSFYRWGLVILLLVPFVIKSVFEHKGFIRKEWKSLSLLSLLSVATYTSCIYVGLQHTTVINAALLNASVPILIILLSSMLLNEKLTLLKLLGAVFSIFGVFILIMAGNITTVLDLYFNQGDFFVVVAAVSWALFSVLYKKLQNPLPPLTFLFVTAVIGECILLPEFLYEIKLAHSMQVNITTVMGIFYAGFFSSLIAFTCWNFGVRNVGPSKAGYFFNLLPVFSFMLALTILGEQFHYYQLVGTFFIFLGILIALTSKNQKRQASLLKTSPLQIITE